MTGAGRVVILVGAVSGAAVTGACAILIARYATPILLSTSRVPVVGVVAFLMVLGASMRWKKVRKMRSLGRGNSLPLV